MRTDRLVYMLLQIAALIIGIVVHESAHAAAAFALGDKTARRRGRISLNPLRHIDPFGTVVLPAIMLALGGPVFAFAKPVPIDLRSLKHPKRDEVLIALAGPVSNVLVSFAATAAMRAMVLSIVPRGALDPVLYLFDGLQMLVLLNLSLAFFNLIPLPPLDGSSILVPFLKGKALRTYYEIQRYAMPILIVVLYLLPSVLRIDVVGMYFDVTVYPLFDMLMGFVLH